ncbi:MAG: hypothetical protein HUK15_01175 [Bacteroidales bacterium]|nr:hypothetical protein [Bacteroidales bacterium]
MRSSALYAFYTNSEDSFKCQNATNCIKLPADCTFYFNDRITHIDKSHLDNNNLCNFGFISDNIKTNEIYTIVQIVKQAKFFWDIKNKLIFKNHLLVFPFHIFY